MKSSIICFLYFIVGMELTLAQTLKLTKTLDIVAIDIKGNHTPLKSPLPLMSYEENAKYRLSNESVATIKIDYKSSATGLELKLENGSSDTVILKNILPFGIHSDHVYITGYGDHPLSRAHLFLPDRAPINVILPDNSWNLGYTSTIINDSVGVYALTKRKSWDKATRKRFETIVYPGGSVVYDYYIDTFSGPWQNGLRKCFQQYKLYDLGVFDDAMYHRPDLQWIKQAKMIHLIMGWDDRLYDRKKGKYVLQDFIKKSKILYGGDDIIGIWPTWPALGLDQRNQWDMYRDMPGSLIGVRSMIDQAHDQGVKIFISYNPWDESTRKENHLNGMAELVKTLDADGVILDTRGASSTELQATVDKVKSGVIMYSEGMAVPKDMETIISGRVHNALYYPPLLNLNKLIQPDFSIFRVAEVYKEPIRREMHTALFNGHGIEFNVFHPGNPEKLDDQYLYLGQILRILREHSLTFNSTDWTPLYPSLRDSIYINHWPAHRKDIFTVYNLHPSGFEDKICSVKAPTLGHWIDLWHHEEILLDVKESQNILSVKLDPYAKEYQGTNNEGSVGVIARFDELLEVSTIEEDGLTVAASTGSHILIWPGAPSYQHQPYKTTIHLQTLKLHQLFPKHDDKFVIQLFEGKELIDERIIAYDASTPHKISAVALSRLRGPRSDMVFIPSNTFTWTTTQGDDFIPYPQVGLNKTYAMKSMYMDRHPVTNRAFHQFIKQSNYIPSQKMNYLKHWVNGHIPAELLNHPVVYISYEDAQTYCAWAGKRLPTEVEWQYAAQTAAQWTWPWGQNAGIDTIYAEVVTETLTHIQYETFDSSLANPGNGILDPIGKYPKGHNPYGLTDLVGSVWQMTADQYRSGSYEYIILKGGSYYKPTASWWYVQGGPRPLTWRQMLLKVDQGFERNATVGCRCAGD